MAHRRGGEGDQARQAHVGALRRGPGGLGAWLVSRGGGREVLAAGLWAGAGGPGLLCGQGQASVSGAEEGGAGERDWAAGEVSHSPGGEEGSNPTSRP